MLEINKIHLGDAKELMMDLDNESVDMCITSPPYWGLRDYGIKGQIGLEAHPNQYIQKMVSVFHWLKKALKKTGSFYLNMGDTYYGGNKGYGDTREPGTVLSNIHGDIYGEPNWLRLKKAGLKPSEWMKPKQLMLMSSRLAIALQDDGWILRNDIIWHKPNPMPSSVKDRLNTTFEHIFHFVKSKKYYYDLDSIREGHSESSFNRSKYKESERKEVKTECFYAKRWNPINKDKIELNPLGKNPGDFWSITTQPFPEAHFAVFPSAILIKPIKSSVPNEICSSCGEPRFPISEPTEEYSKKLGKAWHDHKNDIQRGQRYDRSIAGEPCTASYKVVGYTKCSCNAGFKPALVLDPFIGSGTVAYVCKYPGKFGIKKKINWIGFELSPEYIKMANKRLAQSTLEF